MQVVADLHSHSRYARAVSPQMVLPVISEWVQRKGINLVATGDWTHPLWLKELETQLEEAGEGLYKIKNQISNIKNTNQNSKIQKDTLFLLSNELEVLYSQAGRARKIHLLVFAPSFSAVEKINRKLTLMGKNLFSDGRPKLGMTARDLAQLAFEVDQRCLVIPAHAWTPYFGIFGSMSGFDSLDECFGDLSRYIYGIETGLSSDPAMNWRISDLENRAILSFSDAHSPAKLGREATVFDLPEVSYEMIRKAIIGSTDYRLPTTAVDSRQSTVDFPKIAYTIEFYPEEGKYHYTGHRNCGVRHSPDETKKLGATCPVCKRQLTVGVMHRVEQLAHQPRITHHESQIDDYGVKWIKHPRESRPHYTMMVPLLEILSEAIKSPLTSKRTLNEYKKLTELVGNEFSILLQTKPEDIKRVSGGMIREAIEKVRSGDIVVDPGFDGVFGKVKIWGETEKLKNLKTEKQKTEEEQMGLF